MFDRLQALLPRISATERTALEAGTVWVEGELFRGRPDWKRLLDVAYPQLTEAEQAFLDGPTEELCRLVDGWEAQQSGELPEAAWQLLREERFLGLGIPERFGGRGFSALAQSSIVGKLATRCNLLSVVVLIPNSVGPGELLLHHGTPEQQERFLPSLARGEEIPCFALTETEAGSDAASLRAEGRVFRAEDGEPRIRLSFEKRYITLAPIATLVGLAFQLVDPDDLLGAGERPGITSALVPADAPGMKIGERHDPLGLAFPNGPLRGDGVEIGFDRVIGGRAGVGQGWRMLMESLSAGRAISLPAQAVAGAKWVARATGAYARVRRQFGLPIGRFEGIEEKLARIGGLTYLMEATRVVTCGAVDAGERPALVSSIVKVRQTELMRQLAADGMDVLGGAGICRGPRNLLAEAWVAAPIGITVEGANILTRSLVIFGQGALRCHPYLLRELEAVERRQTGELLRAGLGHLRHFLSRSLRAKLLDLTRGALGRSPRRGWVAAYYRRLDWASARFAWLTELALIGLGGDLKRREAISGRFADALSWMYLGFCTLRRFEAEGQPTEDRAFVAWALELVCERIQRATTSLARNFPSGLTGLLLRGPLAAWMRFSPLGRGPTDALGRAVALRLQQPGEQRERLTPGLYLAEGSSLAPLEEAFRLVVATEELRDRLKSLARAGELAAPTLDEQIEEAAEKGRIAREDADQLRRAEEARRRALAVDVFPPKPCADATP